MEPIKVLLVDDHKVVRDGIKYMLKLQEKFNVVVDEAENGSEAVERHKHFDYDLVIMDIKMPEMNGIEATQKITSSTKDARILALSMFDEGPYVKEMIKAGAKGYILKNAGTEELNNAMRALLKGQRYYSSEVAVKLMEPFHDELLEKTPTPAKLAKEILSKRELQILRMIANELTNEQISKKLFISKRTVDSHRQNILNKTRAKNTVGLIKYAIKHNLV